MDLVIVADASMQAIFQSSTLRIRRLALSKKSPPSSGKVSRRAEGVALGCAGMAEFARELQREHGIPVVDGVSVAVGLTETLVRCGLTTSKSGVWARPTRLHLLEKS